jgi:hypothetical protein
MKNYVIFTFWILLTTISTLSAGIITEDTESLLKVSNGKISLSVQKTVGNKITLSAFLNNIEIPSAEIKFTDEKTNLLQPISFNTTKQGTTETSISIKFPPKGEILLTISENSEYLNLANNDFSGKLLVLHQSMAIIVPDPISEDFLVYPEPTIKNVNIPPDNFYFVNLLNGHNAMLSFLWDNEDIKVRTGKNTQDADYFEFTEIALSMGKSIRIGLNGGENIWWKAEENEEFRFEHEIKWVPPFPARWAVLYKKEFPGEKGLMDRWFIIKKTAGKAPRIQPGVGLINVETWGAYMGGVGHFTYPCNFVDAKTIIAYPKFSNKLEYVYDLKFRPLIYPFENINETPTDLLLPLTALKKFFGDDTYKKVICVNSKYEKGNATCGITATIEKIFYRSEEKKERATIIEKIKTMDLFVYSMRKRIEEYMEWNKQIEKILINEESNNNKNLAMIRDFRKGFSEINWSYAAKIEKMKTPEYYSSLAQKYIDFIDLEIDEEKKEEMCKELGRAIRTIGGSQDGLLDKMRRIVTIQRETATSLYAFSSDEQEKRFLELIRRETASILRERVGMEGK